MFRIQGMLCKITHSIEDSCNLEGTPSKILMCVFPISYEIKIDKIIRYNVL